jgi:hypothetical protein
MPLELNGTTGVQGNSGAFVAGTAVASTSGTSIDFTSIPSWVKRITVLFNGVSISATSNNIQIQIGSGSFVTTGYKGGVSRGSTVTVNSSAFLVIQNNDLNNVYSGIVSLATLGANIWAESGNVISSGNDACMVSGGNLTLSGTLDRVRITTVNGTDTFDAGSINILYE